MLFYKRALTIFWLLMLPGCGFQPLHGNPGASGHAIEFRYIQIGIIKDRIGQQLRNELLRRLHAEGRTRPYRYRLVTKLEESISSLAVKKSALATRSDLLMSAGFQLIQLSDNVEVFAASEQVTVSFNIFNSEFATLMAEKSARQRAVRNLSEGISNRLAVFFRSGKKFYKGRKREDRNTRD